MTTSAIGRFLDGDVFHSFRSNPVAVAAAIVAAIMVLGALFAPLVAPHDPFDLKTLDLNNSLLPPAWTEMGLPLYPLGTDDQGRDVLSTILYGSRISLLVGISSVVLAMAMGIGLGLLSGYLGGRLDALIMRVADVQLSFPAILIALLINGVARAVLPDDANIDTLALAVLIGYAAFMVYLIGDRRKPTFAEECDQSCKPRVGVVEHKGAVIGPDWRPSQRNIVCTCR